MTAASGVHPSIYVLIGCPGSGKGTFAQAIKPEGYDHISTGDIAREELAKGTDFGLRYKDAILNHVRGGIPFEEIQRLVEQRLEKALLEQKGVVLDGYPKTKDQCEFLDRFAQKKGLEGKVVFVLLDVKEEAVIDRISYRQTCEKCGKLYNSKLFPSKTPDECDLCHGVLNLRLDNDSSGTIKRVREFKDKVQPLIEYYTSRLNVLDVNASPEVCLERFMNFHRLMHNRV